MTAGRCQEDPPSDTKEEFGNNCEIAALQAERVPSSLQQRAGVLKQRAAKLLELRAGRTKTHSSINQGSCRRTSNRHREVDTTTRKSLLQRSLPAVAATVKVAGGAVPELTTTTDYTHRIQDT